MNSKKYSILIVDDERLNISVLRSILSPEYTVYAANDGEDAIETAEEFLPDLILLDIVMPDMDGYEALAALKRQEKTQNIPVIFITGLNTTDAEVKGLALGAVDYIPKPFNEAIVKLRVKNQLNLIEQFRQQVLMTKISHKFLSDTYIDSLFGETLRIIGSFMSVAEILLYKYDSDDDILICQNEWINPKLDLNTQIGKKLRLEGPTVSVIKNLIEGRSTNLSAINPEDPEEAYRRHNFAHITKPIFVKGQLNAVLNFTRDSRQQEWSESELNLASLVTDILSGVFEREAMERQFSIVEKAPDLVLSIKTDTSVEYANPAFTNVTGHLKSDLMAEGLSLFLTEGMIADLKEKYIPAALKGDSVQYEVEIYRKDGTKRVLATSVFQRDKDSLGLIFRDLTRMRQLEEENAQIFFDGLTGIYNRRFFDETILRIISSSSRTGGKLSLMMVDVDFFKKYNDTYGHLAGDNCLKAIAGAISQSVPRADDFVARYGGEEFVVVLPNTDENGARIVADRIMAKIRDCNIPHESSDIAGRVTLSIGGVTGIIKHTDTPEVFIKKADEMLYLSKQSGRNKYTF